MRANDHGSSPLANVEGFMDWPECKFSFVVYFRNPKLTLPLSLSTDKNNLTLLQFTDSNSTIITDDYRKEQMDYISSISSSLVV